MSRELRFKVFGRVIALVGEPGHWMPFLIGNEGKRRPLDIVIPDFIAEDELCQYLADIFHEGATPSNGEVVPLPPPAPMSDSPYTLTTDRSRLDIPAIHAFLTTSYWSPGIPLAVVEKAIAHSMPFAVLHGDAQIGFARVITDQASFAYLADVYILEAHRGQGLGKRLIRFLQTHPELQNLRRFLLATKDAHSLYADFGFKPLAIPSRMMEIVNPRAYLPADRLDGQPHHD